MLAVVLSGVSLVYALKAHPGGYDVGEVPAAFASVIGRYLN
ncbi:hypothetical protein [Salipiger bermudensis]